MGGIKRSLLAAGLLATTSSAYLFPPPSGSGLASTSTSRAIADRKSTISSRQASGAPSPRMSTMSPSSETQQQQEGVAPAQGRDAGAAGGAAATAIAAGELVSSASAAQLASSLIFPSVTRQPRPGIIARDGTRDDGQRERDDGKSPDFEVNLGKVISTLREDYPRILCEPPEFDIFTDEIELRDPTGVAFRGISNYKRVFATLRFFRQTFMTDATSTTFRLTYDWSKQQVRVTWNMVLQLKARQRPIYVDGISAYHINSNGLAYRHELETVVVNGRAVEPPFAYAWINLPAWVSRGSAGKATAGAALPTPHANAAGPAVAGVAQQQQFASQGELELAGADAGVGALLSAARTDPELRGDYMKALSTVLMMDADGAESGGGGGDGAAGSDSDTAVEDAAAAAKEKNRRAAAAAKKEKKKGGWFGSNGPELACETSWDCTGGMVCCDFVLLKVCCSNGIRQPKFGELIPSLVPIPGRGRNENDAAPRRTPPGGSQRAPRRPGSW